jgi:urea transport system permease protein
MIVWAAVGGRNSLLGACLGAILLNVLTASVSETPILLNAWQLIIGALFILVVLLLPRGFAGLVDDLVDRLTAAKGRVPAPVEARREVRGREASPAAEVLTDHT